MELTQHCKICDNKIIDFKIGALCGLTDKKPEFQNKCNVIKLDVEYKKEIELVNIEYEAVKKTKIDTIGHIILYSGIALALFVGGYLCGKFVFEKGVISAVPLIIMGLGIGPLAIAFGPLNLYVTSSRIATNKKKTLDDLCKMYGFNYEIDITHLKDSLGNKFYDTDLKIRKTSNTL